MGRAAADKTVLVEMERPRLETSETGDIAADAVRFLVSSIRRLAGEFVEYARMWRDIWGIAGEGTSTEIVEIGDPRVALRD